MKKILFSIAAAAMAMAACTQTNVVYEDSTEIGLAPFNYTSTKLNYGPVDGTDYPSTETLGVFAQHTTSNAQTSLNGDGGVLNPYLVQAGFAEDATETGIWTGTPDPYYWPRTGSLYFAGYSPYGTTGTLSYDFNTDNTQNMNIDGFEQGEYVYTDGTSVPAGYSMIDLMWFDASTSSNTGTVAATFNHALTYLTFNFTAAVDDLFTIKSVTLENVYFAGDFDSNNGNPTWSGLNDQKNMVLYNTDVVLKKDTPFTVEDVLVIPQTTSFITIVYTQKASAANPEITMEYKAQLTGGENDGATDLVWHYGKHYTYSISIAADEIKIDPDVKEWTIINKQINVE